MLIDPDFEMKIRPASVPRAAHGCNHLATPNMLPPSHPQRPIMRVKRDAMDVVAQDNGPAVAAYLSGKNHLARASRLHWSPDRRCDVDSFMHRTVS